MDFSKNLEYLQDKLGLTTAGLEKKLGLGNGYIAGLLSGGEKGIKSPGKLLVALVNHNISTDWFLTGKGEMFLASAPSPQGQELTNPAGGHKVPLLRQRVSCGPGIDWETDDNIEEYIDIFSILPRLATGRMYAFKASGSSMLGAGIRSGDYLIFDAELDFIPKDDIYVFTLDGEVYCKRLEFDMLAHKMKIYSVRVADLEKAELVRTLDMTETSYGDRFRIFGKVRYLLRPNRGDD
jgi:SOS-response transcriptional repressor LexA